MRQPAVISARQAAGSDLRDDRDSWFFIIGCQRSGTTLMRLVLECHSKIQCCDEAASYPILAGRRPVPPRERDLLGFKVPCLTEQFADASVWDAFLMPKIPNFYRGQKIVFMMRDVRDTIVSMRGLRAHGRSWLDAHLMPALRAKITRDAAFRRRYATAISQLSGSRHPKLARAAFYWRYKAEALYDYLDRGFPVLLMRYEDLVERAPVELLRACGFLQVPWEPALLSHQTFAHAELDDGGMAVGGTDANRPIDRQSVDRWQHSFTDDELDVILRFAGDLHDTLYPSSVPA